MSDASAYNPWYEPRDSTREWARKHGYAPRFVDGICEHLYGKPAHEAIAQLRQAITTPHGHSPQGARGELARMIDNSERIANTLSEVLGLPDA